MANTIPQDPSSVMRFVDGADERELMSMLSAKNPYSFMALAKLQSIRDLKMKEQAGQPNPFPMSEQIPQQLAQLASGQPMQQPMQQQPMQQPMQQQGIASIGGEATGAGGGMVSFTDGGGVRRFASEGAVSAPEESTSRFGDAARSLLPAFPSEAEIRARVKEQKDAIDLQKQRSEAAAKLAERMRENHVGPFTATTPSEREKYAQNNKQIETELNVLRYGATPKTGDLEERIGLKSNLLTGSTTPVANVDIKKSKDPGVAEKPAINNAGNNAGNATPSAGGNLNPEKIYKDYEGRLAPLFKQKEESANAGITALTNAQTAMLPYYDQKRLAEFNPTDAERETLRQSKQTDLEKAFPNPYTKTANTLELLQKNLENSEANTFNKALFKASLALMGNKSPKFFQAASEAGLVGVEDYGRMQDANQKQRMALMNADTALATAQDSRKRGLYDQSAKQVSESLQFKKDAFLADREATLAKGNMAIALEGKKAELPDLKIKQAQDLFNLQHGLYTDKFKIAEFNQRGAQIKASSTPEMGKMIEWAAKNPEYAGQIYDERSRAMYSTVIKEAMEIFAKDQMSTPEQKKINFDATVKAAVDAYAKQYPRPMAYGK